MKLIDFEDVDKGARGVVAEATVKEVAQKINDFFVSRGYKLEEGTMAVAKYGIGNMTMRMLFGAFVKRFQFNIAVEEVAGEIKFAFSKSGSGMSGGLIGMKKTTTEMIKIRDLMKTIFD